MTQSYNSKHKYVDPKAVALPLAIDWTKWLEKQGPDVTLVSAEWVIPSTMTKDDEIVQTYEADRPTVIYTYAVLNLTPANAAPGIYECECHVKSSTGVEDSARLYVHVEEQ